MKFQMIIALLLALTSVGCASLENKTFSDDAGAIRGYDPVAYFTEGKPVKGKSQLTAEHEGGVYHFASEANRERFVADPTRYAPQYGGYCAYGLSKGFIVKTDPEAFTIHDNKLYLNYSLGVRATWSKDKDGNISKANAHWADKLKNGIEG